MSTQAQIAANQANAQHSTGPRSEAGKANASFNNFRHGLAGRFMILPWEKKEEFEALWVMLREEHKPVTPTETLLVERMAQHYWLSQRALNLQDLCFNRKTVYCDEPKDLALYLRYQATHERAFHKCLNDLLRLRAEKRKTFIGFESHEWKREQETRRESAEKRRQELHTWALLLAKEKLKKQEMQNCKLAQPKPVASHTENCEIASPKAA